MPSSFSRHEPRELDEMRYETGMHIEYEPLEGVVLIHFRGERYRIVRKFNSYSDAIAAGEQLCRGLGWSG